MNREELLKLFKIDDHGIILTDGQFKEQPLYVAYFWLLYITGYSDALKDDEVTFFVRAEDRMQFKELSEGQRIRLKQLFDGRIIEVTASDYPGLPQETSGNGHQS